MSLIYSQRSIFRYEKGSIRLLAYCAEIISGEIRLIVNDEFQWVSATDSLKIQIADGR